MRKKEERQIMRQKINISEALLNQWVDNYKTDIRQMIHPSLMEESDLGTTFEHQGRQFEIVGMSSGGSLMVRETREEGVFYWETTRAFVQMKLGRFNREFFKVAGKTQLREVAYPESKLYLAPLNKRIKKEEEDPIDEQYVDSDEDDNGPVHISYEEDGYDDIQNED